MPKFWFWQFFFVILAFCSIALGVDAESVTVSFNFNATHQGVEMFAFETPRSYNQPALTERPPIGSPWGDGLWDDITTDSDLDSDDGSAQVSPYHFTQYVAQLIVIKLPGSIQTDSITKINVTVNQGGYGSTNYHYIWNVTSGTYVSCGGSGSSNYYGYCVPSSSGQETVNSSGYIHHIHMTSAGNQYATTDYVVVTITYTLGGASANYSMNVSDEILVLEVKNLESSFFRLNYESFSWNDFPYKNGRYVRTRYEPSGVGEFQSKNAALKVSSQDSVKGSDVLTKRFWALRDSYEPFTNSLNVVKGRFAFLMVYENADLQSASEVRSSFWRVTYSFAPVLDTVNFAKSLVRSVTDAFGVSDFFVQKFSFFRDWYEPFELSDFFSGRYSCPLGWCEISAGGGGEVVLPPGGGGGFLGEEVEEPVFAEVLGHEVLVPQFLVRIWGNIKWLFSEENFKYILPVLVIILFVSVGTVMNVHIARANRKKIKSLEEMEVEVV